MCRARPFQVLPLSKGFQCQMMLRVESISLDQRTQHSPAMARWQHAVKAALAACVAAATISSHIHAEPDCILVTVNAHLDNGLKLA